MAAVASIMASMKRHVGGVIDLMSRGDVSDLSTYGHRTHRVLTRQAKPFSGLRARSRAMRPGPVTHRRSQLAPRQIRRARKAVKHRQFEFRLTQFADGLAIE
jgi:hypothetical protein